MANDVVVVGGGVAGLSASIYARLAGHSVLLLEQHSKLGGKAGSVEIGNYRLDPGPSIIILKRLYDQLFRDAGRLTADYLDFRQLPILSKVWMDGRDAVELPANLADCLGLVDQLDKKDGSEFKALMQRMDRVAPLMEQTIFQRPIERQSGFLNPKMLALGMALGVGKPYRQQVDSMFRDPMLRAFFYGFPSYSGQSYQKACPAAFLLPYLMLTEGVFYPTGGVAAIPLALQRLALELGVTVETDAEVKSVELSSSRVSSVVLGSGQRVEGSHFICALDRLTFERKLGRVFDFPPSFSYTTVHWGLRKKFEVLSHHNLFVPSSFEKGFEQLYLERKLPTDPIVYVNETSGLDRQAAPAGCSNLFAVVSSPGEESHIDWEAERERFVPSVRNRLSLAGIEFADAEIEFERVQTPTYFRQQHGSYKGSLYGADEQFRLFGMLPLRNRDEKLKNLFYAGGAVQPGAGLPMVLLSGKFAAACIR